MERAVHAGFLMVSEAESVFLPSETCWLHRRTRKKVTPKFRKLYGGLGAKVLNIFWIFKFAQVLAKFVRFLRPGGPQVVISETHFRHTPQAKQPFLINDHFTSHSTKQSFGVLLRVRAFASSPKPSKTLCKIDIGVGVGVGFCAKCKIRFRPRMRRPRCGNA